MKVIGGSFGLKGRAEVANLGLGVYADAEGIYQWKDIESVNATQSKEKHFGIGSFLVGGLIFGGIGLVLMGIVGGVLGLLFAVAGSFYSTNKRGAEVKFNDGKTVSLKGSAREVKKLVAKSAV